MSAIVLQLSPVKDPTLVYRNPALGKLAVSDSGTIYTMEGNRLIQLDATAGYALALVTDGATIPYYRTEAGGGTASANPPGPLMLPGTTVHVTAQPSEGWTFLTWEGDRSDTTPELDIVMTNHLTLKPIFVTTGRTPSTNGLVLREPDQEFYHYRDRLKLTAQPDEGFEFVRWSDGSTNAVREFNVNDPVTWFPIFSALPRYTVTASVLGGEGGAVVMQPEGPDYLRDTVVHLSARPVPGYVFQVWLDNNLSNPRTISVQSNTTLFAVFAPGQGISPHFTSTPPSRVERATGTTLTLRAEAEGSTPLDCQWYHQGAILPGATSPELTVTNLQAGDAGVYRLVVDNGLGSATHETEVIVSTLTIDAIRWDEQLGLQFSLSGETNRVFRIYFSSDLQAWNLLTTVTNLTGTYMFHDPTEPRPATRFYKAE